jgi:hypothetical protein
MTLQDARQILCGPPKHEQTKTEITLTPIDLTNYLAEIPTFSGRSSSGTTFQEWLDKFENIARCAEWSLAKKLQFLTSKLTDTAFDYIKQ